MLGLRICIVKMGDNNNLPEDISLISGGYSFLGLGLRFYINSLSKILVCVVDYIVFILDLFLSFFLLLDSFFVSIGFIWLF
jgi:hypothetical protein